MKKLIIKTAIVTFISVILGVALIFTVISFITPQTMSEFTYSLGMEEASCKYAVKAYDKSGELEDLDTVLVKALATEDYCTLKKYSKEMIDRDEFSTLTKTYKSTVTTYYVLALVETADEQTFSKTVEVYQEFYTTYDTGNPVSMLLTFSKDYDDEFMDFANGLTSTQTLISDINKVNDR